MSSAWIGLTVSIDASHFRWRPKYDVLILKNDTKNASVFLNAKNSKKYSIRWVQNMLKNGLSDEMIIFLLYMKIKRGTFYLHCLTHVWTVFDEHRVSIFVNKIEQFNSIMVKNLFKIWLNITVFRNSLIFRYCFPRCLATHKPRVTWEWILNRKSSIRGRQVIGNFITFSQHRKTIFSGWRKNFLKWFWIFDKFSITKCFTLSKK